LSNDSWGAGPSPLVSDHAAGVGAGEGLAPPSSPPPPKRRRYRCKVEKEFWVGNELKDFILGDSSWVVEACVEFDNSDHEDLRHLQFDVAMKEARAILAMKRYRFVAIPDRAGVMVIRYDREAKAIQTLYRFYAYVEALVELISDKPRNLKRDRRDRRRGWGYLGAITFTVDPSLGNQFEVDEYLNYAVSQFWNKFSKHYHVEVLRICVKELQASGYPHLHCIFWVSEPLEVFRWRGRWRFEDKRVWEAWYPLGNIDAFALPKLKHAVSYLKKYLTKQATQSPSGSQESAPDSQDQLGMNWKGWEIEFRWVTRRRILTASRVIQQKARELLEMRKITKSDILERRKLPVASVGGVSIAIDSKALSLARVFRNYVLASERHRNATGIEVWIDHPSVQLYSDLIIIFTSLDVSDLLRIRLYIADLRRGLDPPPDLWQIMFRIWVIDSFTA